MDRTKRHETRKTSDNLIIPEVPPTWSQKLFGGTKTSRRVWLSVGVVAFVLVNLMIAKALQKPQIFQSKAAVDSAKLSIVPAQQTLAGDGTFQVWLNADHPVGFAAIELNFNTSLLKLTQAVSLTNTSLTRSVLVTPQATANASGKIDMVIGLDPAKRSTAPTGTFQVATLHFAPNTPQKNLPTSVDFNASYTQIVADDASVFATTGTGTSIQLNPFTPTATPAPTAQPTSQPTATGAPVPTHIPITPPPSCTPVNGTWGYGPWSNCTAQCGGGIQMRTAQCGGASCGGTCSGLPVVSQTCNVQACANKLTIYAAGTSCQGTYPTMQLLINNKVIATWKDVRGNPFLRIFDQFVYQSPVAIAANKVKVAFINDCYKAGKDRNLTVDKIKINDTVYETEASSTYSKGVWSKKDGCKAGYKKSEQLSCEGYVQYLDRP